MQTESETDGRLVIAEVFESMADGFRRHRPLILRMTLLFALLNAASNLLNLSGAAGTAVSIGILLLLSVAYGGLITALICLPRMEATESLGELWAAITPVLGRLVWVTLITIIAVFAGLMVLVVPGLILVTVFAVATQVVVVEQSDTFAALGRSAELVRGNGFRVFGFVLLLAIAALLLIAILATVTIPVLGTGILGTTASVFLQNVVVAPLLAIGPAALYDQLIRAAGPADRAPAPPTP